MQQALRAGVPMITSGVGQDKRSIGALINHTGVGLYHAVSHVTTEMLSDALKTVLKDNKYMYVFAKYLLQPSAAFIHRCDRANFAQREIQIHCKAVRAVQCD